MRISYWKGLAAKVSFKNTRLIKIFGKEIRTKSAHLIFYDYYKIDSIRKCFLTFSKQNMK